MTIPTQTSEHPEWLSGGKWLQLAVEPKDVDTIPADGIDLTYNFSASSSGNSQIWARMGFESARPEFDWRIDAADWQHIDSKNLCTDLMELSFFTEIEWLHLGDQSLSAGAHKLELRIPRQITNGKPQRLLFAADCFCISAGSFQPNSKFKPDEDPRTDADRAAENNVFHLPASVDAARVSLPLKGNWQICRDDEVIPAEVDQPIKQLPANPVWSAIEVPGNKAEVRPDLTFAHRVWYRTRIDVPAAGSGHSFTLNLPEVNLNATVFVNGTYCGFAPYPFAHSTIDLTKAVKPGQVNEVEIGVRDAWYGYYRDPNNPVDLRRDFVLPVRFLSTGFQDFVYPIWNHAQSGLLETPSLVVAGSTYASDVFVKPSVSKNELAADVTVQNSSTAPATGDVLCEALDPRTQQVAKSLPPVPFTVAAGEQKIVNISAPWIDAKLWWPDPNPALYTLRTTVRLNNQPADVSDTTFGFREWSWEGHDFKLNGIVWHGWADITNHSDLNKWLAFYRKTNERFFRFWAPNKFFGMEDDAALDWFDRNGIVIRRTGVFDGESMGYQNHYLDQLCKNAVAQEEAKIRGERNHPSIMIWSLENEISFINAMNANWINEWEKWTAQMWQTIHTDIDPTRPAMTDGGGAGKANLLPVAGDHYIVGDPSAYPALAYQSNDTGGGRNRWVWDEKRPRFVGEDFFFAGNHPELSALGGDVAFGGKAATLHACGLMWQILQQGYRWADLGAWNYWLNQSDADDSQFTYYAPRAALVKEWDWTLPSGVTVHRTVGLFNDSHTNDPMTFAWALNLNGTKVAGESAEYTVPAGTRKVIDLAIPVPAIEGRQEGELTLSLSVAGQQVFKDTKAVSVLKPAIDSARAGNSIAVYDPAGKIGPFLRSHRIAFSTVENLKSLPASAHLLIIGKDAITPDDSTSSDFAAFAAGAHVVVVLEQKNALQYQALPAEMETSDTGGEVGFPEDLDHPAMKGLQQKDFFTWSSKDNDDVFAAAYVKPTRGARSLLQCGPLLKNTALVEIPVGKGLMLLSQLLLEDKLDSSPVAQQLLLNLVAYGSTYKQTFRDVSIVADAPTLSHAIDSMGLKYAKAADPLDAIAKPGSIAVISATSENLAKLAGNFPAVQSFTSAGGWIIFNGLTPDGLPSYNKIVGVEHLIRPFTQERVTFAPIHDSLLAGVTTSDIAMYSSKKMFGFQEGNYVASDEFSYVVDYDDVAPFATSTFGNYDKITNGFVSADGWPLIINFPINADGSPFDVPIKLARPETLTQLTWIGNTFYWPQTKINLIFDGDTSKKLSFDVEPNNSPQTLKIDPPRQASQVTLEIAGWQEVPNVKPLIGIDNIYLTVQRSPDFLAKVKPMLNVGGLVRYPMGSGGIVLCNLNFKPNEEVPLNAVKKQNILATILRNLKAPFAGSDTVTLAANLSYTPIDISQQANQYRDEKGWFDRTFTFADLPTGKQKFAGVNYDVYEFATSPVPTVIMLGGPRHLPTTVTGIPVNQKADSLFFLQTARIDKPLSRDEMTRDAKPELFHYLVHYADGSTQAVPVYLGTDIENFKQAKPKQLPGARLAWTLPYAGTDFSAVAYSQEWNDPKRDVTIESIDVVTGQRARGVPVVLAITAGIAK